ncbi:MBL fold metallo-hydrolase [Salaquimonas pukyongi]|uniref:MBL fold metallo-hydrolase n=1 Tax=Salaquimonas pukyongi TaxID=2712698 RepID=UPI0009FB5156|nr:MBL fold metallo-hydrolase [Salaquimonas pukyongi]
MSRRKKPSRTGAAASSAFSAMWWSLRPFSKNPFYRGPVSDHFDGKRFYNEGGTPPGTFKDLVRWKLQGERTKWPARYDSPFERDVPPQRVAADTARVTHVGHASFLIQTNGLNFLTDPVWAERASPLGFAGPKRVNPPGIDFDALPPIDAVLLTHSHYDHMDLPTLAELVEKHDPLIITPLGNDAIIQKTVPEARTATGDWSDTARLSNDTVVHFEPCHHWGARGLRDVQMTLWCAFSLETPGLKIHHVGDTAFHKGAHFRAAAQKHGGFDLAILPIGAYEPRWFMKAQHINPQEAVEGFRLLGAKRAIGHHWGTFQLTDEPVSEPKEKLAEALAEAGIQADRFEAAHPGQVFILPPPKAN